MGNAQHHVIIIGGGFAGLSAAKDMANLPVKITLIDKRNFHLFQPLLYQVATGTLSPGDIAAPLRDVLCHHSNIEVLMGEATDIDPDMKTVAFDGKTLSFDSLILAPGGTHQYFGHDDWEDDAPSLKTLEDALEIRRRSLLAFEMAEKEPDPNLQKAWLTFLIIGGGPTGVELAGALAETAHSNKLKLEFRNINPKDAQIILAEAGNRILSNYPEDLIQKAERDLEKRGVQIRTRWMVSAISPDTVTIRYDDTTEELCAKTILWTAGVKASPLGTLLAQKAGAQLDKGGRVIVQPDLSVPGYPDIFVIGDLANFSHQNNHPLPGLASVAMQEGHYVAEVIANRIQGKPTGPFQYRDKGMLAIIGRNAAIADFGRFKLSGFPAWLLWLFVHIYYLIGFENKILVMLQWAWSYLRQSRSTALITEPKG